MEELGNLLDAMAQKPWHVFRTLFQYGIARVYPLSKDATE